MPIPRANLLQSALGLLLGCLACHGSAGGGDPMVEQPADIPLREGSLTVGGSSVHYLEAGPESGSIVLFLHGARFDSKTWDKLGSLKICAQRGYRALALDLPGFGASPKSSLGSEVFLEAFLDALNAEGVVIISPSMSGRFSLPFVARHSAQVRGYVPIAPAAVRRYGKELTQSPVPTLVLWGSNDRVFPVSGAASLAALFRNAKTYIFEGASHPCYLDQPAEFHAALLGFLSGLPG